MKRKDTSSTNDQSFARSAVQTENVVTGDTILQSTRDLWISRSSTNSYDNIFRSVLFFSVLVFLLEDTDNGMLVFEIPIGIYVLDIPAMNA